MKDYFKRIYQKGNILYCMNELKAFKGTNGKNIKESYHIYKSELQETEPTDWEPIYTSENKDQAIKRFESYIK